MSKLEKVKGYRDLVKDTANGGVVNIDLSAYEQHKRVKEQILLKQQESKANLDMVQSLQTEINCMKTDMSEIKSLLISIMTKGK
jgi:hypothetical protein